MRKDVNINAVMLNWSHANKPTLVLKISEHFIIFAV